MDYSDCDQVPLFETFIERTANIPIIWEKIMLNLRGTDVANCMKVSRSLRKTMNQCLASNSKLRQKIHLAARKSAISRGKFKMELKVHFEKGFGDAQTQRFFALDGVWYYTHGDRSSLDILKYYFEDDTSSFTRSLRFQPHPLLWVEPTPDPERYFVRDELVEYDSARETFVHAKASETIAPDFEDILHSEEMIGGRPICSQYRLDMKKEITDEGELVSIGIHMHVLSPKGESIKSIMLHNYDRVEHRYVTHSSSNEQVTLHEFLVKYSLNTSTD